jgi:hypothetical protein
MVFWGNFSNDIAAYDGGTIWLQATVESQVDAVKRRQVRIYSAGGYFFASCPFRVPSTPLPRMAAGRSGAFASARWAMRHALELRGVGTWLDKQLPVMSPSSRSRLCWDILVMGMVMYNAVLVPFDAGNNFSVHTPHPPLHTRPLYRSPRTSARAFDSGFRTLDSGALKALDMLIDCVFALDILVSLRTAYINSMGDLIRDGKQVATNYLGSSRFPIDVCAVFPFEMLVALVSRPSKNRSLKVGGGGAMRASCCHACTMCLVDSGCVLPSMLVGTTRPWRTVYVGGHTLWQHLVEHRCMLPRLLGPAAQQ